MSDIPEARAANPANPIYHYIVSESPFFQVDKMGLGFSLIKREVFDKAYVIFNKEPIFYFESSVNPFLTGL
jgi:hypothetical protein